MSTHVYPPAQPPAPGTLPTCGCGAPDWCDPGNTLAGCVNCGRGIDRRLCCDGTPTSDNGKAWIAERSRLEVLRVAAAEALFEVERLQRIDQRRKDAGHERSVETSIRRKREAVAAGGRWENTIRGSRHMTADSAAAGEAIAALRTIERSIATLAVECFMCADTWRHRSEHWVGAALVSAEVVDAQERLETAAHDLEKCRKRGAAEIAQHPVALRQALKNDVEARHALDLAMLRAVEAARLRSENKA